MSAKDPHAQDLSDRDRLDNQRFMAVFNSVHYPIVLVAYEGIIDTANPAFEEQFGYGPGELSGSSITTVIEQTYVNHIMLAIESIASHNHPQLLTIIGRHRNGTHMTVEMEISNILGDDQYFLCTVHNHSDLDAVHRMKDYMTHITHDVRNPLTIIMLGLQMLEQFHTRFTEERRIEKLHEIYQQAQIINTLMESALQMAQKNMDLEQPTQKVDINQLLLNIVSEQNIYTAHKGQHVVLCATKQPIFIEGNPIELAGIWRNLIDNAVKYTPEGGTITLRLDVYQCAKSVAGYSVFVGANDVIPVTIQSLPVGHYMVGQVKDSGYGMDAADLEHVFKRFHRGWAEHSGIPGTGLGLFLVREILKQYGGDVGVSSTKGIGSIFTFWIPITSDQVSATVQNEISKNKTLNS